LTLRVISDCRLVGQFSPDAGPSAAFSKIGAVTLLFDSPF